MAPCNALTDLNTLQSEYEAVIGIECHVQLNTKTKAFCSCPNEYGAEPNTHVCPVCLGHPVRSYTLTIALFKVIIVKLTANVCTFSIFRGLFQF